MSVRRLDILMSSSMGCRSGVIRDSSAHPPGPSKRMSRSLPMTADQRIRSSRNPDLRTMAGSSRRVQGSKASLRQPTACVVSPTFGGTVADSGEGGWTVGAANDEEVPALVLTAALFRRFASRNLDLFQNKVLSGMRFGFGGHVEKRK